MMNQQPILIPELLSLPFNYFY
jgi:hypothetical protein